MKIAADEAQRQATALDEHRIRQVNIKRVRNRYPRLYGKNSKRPEHGYGYEMKMVELITDQGALGWGSQNDAAVWKTPYRMDLPRLKEAFLGKKVSELFHPEVGVLVPEATQIEFALHDLAGKILEMPVYAMLGSVEQERVPCYDGAIYFNDISPDSRPGGVQAILEDCRQDEALGYRDFKVKIGRGGKWMPFEEGLQRDIEVIRLIRQHYPERKILVDANDAYTLPGLLRFLEGVVDCDLFWIEEPFIENREDFLRLKEYLSRKSPQTLIADGESDPDIDLLIRLADEKLLDVFLMDIEGFGFTRWRQILPQIKEKGYLISPHNWGSKLKTHYTAHLARACKNAITIEGVPDLTEGVEFDGYQLIDGQMVVPDRPGFGMDFIWGLEQ